MDIQESLGKIREYISTCDWSDPDFTWEKAFVNSVMSNVAYCHIADFELDNTTNVNLIPSSEYEKSIRSYIETNVKADIGELLRSFGIDSEIHVIESQFAIAAAIRVGEVVFVALRGTEFFNIHDWRANLNALKASPGVPLLSDARFHKGFYKCVISFKNRLETAINKRFGENIYIYVTGHSLGGAMAAILFGLWCDGYTYDNFRGFKPSGRNKNYGVVSSYTIGMPRYGNLAAVAHYSNPYHILNSKDIVPHFPPKYLGYEDGVNIISLDKSLVLRVKYFGYLKYLKSMFSFLALKKLEHHSIENYVGRIFYEIKNS